MKKDKNKFERRRLKADVIAGYGGKCDCCGEDRVEFLVIDHAEGGGEEHRKSQKNFNHETWYRKLRQERYPEEVDGFRLRVLCHNCNQSFGSYGYCPHQEPERTRAEFPFRQSVGKQERLDFD